MAIFHEGEDEGSHCVGSNYTLARYDVTKLYLMLPVYN